MYGWAGSQHCPHTSLLLPGSSASPPLAFSPCPPSGLRRVLEPLFLDPGPASFQSSESPSLSAVGPPWGPALPVAVPRALLLACYGSLGPSQSHWVPAPFSGLCSSFSASPARPVPEPGDPDRTCSFLGWGSELPTLNMLPRCCGGFHLPTTALQCFQTFAFPVSRCREGLSSMIQFRKSYKERLASLKRQQDSRCGNIGYQQTRKEHL